MVHCLDQMGEPWIATFGRVNRIWDISDGKGALALSSKYLLDLILSASHLSISILLLIRLTPPWSVGLHINIQCFEEISLGTISPQFCVYKKLGLQILFHLWLVEQLLSFGTARLFLWIVLVTFIHLALVALSLNTVVLWKTLTLDLGLSVKSSCPMWLFPNSFWISLSDYLLVDEQTLLSGLHLVPSWAVHLMMGWLLLELVCSMTLCCSESLGSWNSEWLHFWVLKKYLPWW